jgi:hypothetical protein
MNKLTNDLHILGKMLAKSQMVKPNHLKFDQTLGGYLPIS